MSDGPHRSLPLRPHWKAVAERASRDAWAVEDVAEATSRAVESDLREVPLRALRRILGADPEGSLFANDSDAVISELDQARAECRGSVIGNDAIEGAIQAVHAGFLHLDHLADMADTAARAEVSAHAVQLGLALGTPAAETEQHLRDLLEQHKSEWEAYMDSLGARSFLADRRRSAR